MDDHKLDGTEGLIPGICTQCGANVEVDSNLRRATCPYCGTQFIVDQAVKNYEIKQAQFQNVNTVNINNKGAAESAFDFLDKQINRVEGYAGKAIEYKERKKREAQEEEERFKAEHHGLNKSSVALIWYLIAMGVILLFIVIVMKVLY